ESAELVVGSDIRPRARLGDALEPGFTPVRINLSGAKPACRAVLARTHCAVERNAVTFEFDHVARAVVDEPADSLANAKRAAAKWEHLVRIEPQAAVRPSRRQCGDDISS